MVIYDIVIVSYVGNRVSCIVASSSLNNAYTAHLAALVLYLPYSTCIYCSVLFNHYVTTSSDLEQRRWI